MVPENADKLQTELCDILSQMTESMSSARELVKSLRAKHDTSDDLDTKDGISLLSLKHHLLLSYTRCLALACAHRAVGNTLTARSIPALPFSSLDRRSRGSNAGDLVDSMIEARVVLEKVKILESRMRYQIEKLVRVAEEASTAKDVLEDPLAFRPNPENFMNNEADDSDDEGAGADHEDNRDGIYRPPKLAPMPYTERTKDKNARRQPIPSALNSLLRQDPSRPHVESSSGLGATPALSSNRSREIQRMAEFEEENFTRLVMKKKDARRRKRDEEDIALGGMGGARGRRRGAGLEEEFDDILRSVGRTKNAVTGSGDGYEELRKRGKKVDALSRSRMRPRETFDDVAADEGPRRKRTRFEQEKVSLSRRMAKSKKK